MIPCMVKNLSRFHDSLFIDSLQQGTHMKYQWSNVIRDYIGRTSWTPRTVHRTYQCVELTRKLLKISIPKAKRHLTSAWYPACNWPADVCPRRRPACCRAKFLTGMVTSEVVNSAANRTRLITQSHFQPPDISFFEVPKLYF